MAIGDDDSSSGVVVSGSGGVGVGDGDGVGGGSVGVCIGGGPGLFRSRSLPHLLGNDSGVGGSFSDGGCPDGGGGLHHLHGGAPLPGHCSSKSQPAGLSGLGDVRQLVTLKQHYYPEGGWGWVVAAVAVAAHLLAHGLHLAAGIFVQELVDKFGPGTVVPAGYVVTIIYYACARRFRIFDPVLNSLQCDPNPPQLTAHEIVSFENGRVEFH
ncbi:Hypothetical protein CINCED_3A011425 [Cinara cedri]|uniref:Uncharacterized protein n=1 Tax=Cinara cedri TaxID=506608 RepID=A0A5E4MS35_9HEMI|nr:Hypothetical protein CINCED_3A011425 [Cinara cedri]